MDKNQRSPNPKLAPPWERGTIVQRGVTGTSYKVEQHDRKRKRVKIVNVQQIKPFEEEGEETVIAQPPRQRVTASSRDAARRVRLRRGRRLLSTRRGPRTRRRGEQRRRTRHTVAGPRNTVARRRNAVASRIPAVARDPAPIRGDDDTSSI
jgi:hypothetical protein